MTTTRDELRTDVELGKRLTGTIDAGADSDYYPAMERIFDALPVLLDQLDAAEARIRAVQDELLAVEGSYASRGAPRWVSVDRIRRALEG